MKVKALQAWVELKPSTPPWTRMFQDVRMFTIGAGTAQILKTLVAGALLEMKTPQTRGGFLERREAC